MDFSLSAQQRELKEAAVAFARRELDRDLAEREEAGEFSPRAWRACAKFAIQGLPIPAGLGGGGDILTTVLVMEGLGYGCHDNGLIFSLDAQLWSLELPLVKFGSPAQQQAYLPGLMAGDLIGVHAMTEPGSGSDAFSMRTRAERHGEHYVLTGTKLYITTALYQHPAIREAVVLSIPDELLGNRLRTIISVTGPGTLTRQEVLEHCKQRLPGYMVSDNVEFCQKLPRTSTGKVDRTRLTAAR